MNSRNANLWRAMAPVLGAFSFASCSDDHVIRDREPFMRMELPYAEADTGRMLQDLRTFARANDMELAESFDEPRLGDYNVWVTTRDLNLIAIHKVDLSPDRTTVVAVSRRSPGSGELRLARRFACTAAGRCRPTDVPLLEQM